MKPNPYDTRGEIFLKSGMLDEAIASYELALVKKPDFYSSRSHLAFLYIYKGEFDKAQPLIDDMMRQEIWNRRGLRSLIPGLQQIVPGSFSRRPDPA